jgi:hypothetical protein
VAARRGTSSAVPRATITRRCALAGSRIILSLGHHTQPSEIALRLRRVLKQHAINVQDAGVSLSSRPGEGFLRRIHLRAALKCPAKGPPRKAQPPG